MGPVARGKKVDDRGGKEGGQGRRAENRARAFLGASPAKSNKVRASSFFRPKNVQTRVWNRPPASRRAKSTEFLDREVVSTFESFSLDTTILTEYRYFHFQYFGIDII